jgi:hypothetical protein
MPLRKRRGGEYMYYANLAATVGSFQRLPRIREGYGKEGGNTALARGTGHGVGNSGYIRKEWFGLCANRKTLGYAFVQQREPRQARHGKLEWSRLCRLILSLAAAVFIPLPAAQLFVISFPAIKTARTRIVEEGFPGPRPLGARAREAFLP